MKRFLVASLFSLALATGARAEIQVVAQTTINSGRPSISDNMVYQVTLTSDGILSVNPSNRPLNYKLSEKTMDDLMDAIRYLSTQDYNIVRSKYICMTLVAPGHSPSLKIARDYDFETQKFNGALETVLTTAGCWSYTHINMQDPQAEIAAQRLLGQLQVLAQEAIVRE